MADATGRVNATVSDTNNGIDLLAKTGAVSSYTLYPNEMVEIDSDGYLDKGGDDSGARFAGLVASVENILVDDATTQIRVNRPVEFQMNTDRVFAQTDVGLALNLKDSQTVQTGGSNTIGVGHCLRLGENSGQWCYIRSNL